MPKYEYECPRCGAFSDFRPIAEYELPAPCPNCGVEAPRAAVSVPAIASGAATPSGGATRADRPGFRHRAGCRCCAGTKIPRAEWTSKLL